MAINEFRIMPRPERESSATGDLGARQRFEAYGVDVQSMKVATGIGIITGAWAGVTAGGIPGLVVGAALGGLSGYWKGKAYRRQVYAQFDALGLLKKRTIGYRSILGSRTGMLFMRLPYGPQTAQIIVPIIQKNYPDMSEAQLNEIGKNAQTMLLNFRRTNADIPISLAAEAILLYHGIMRDDAGDYALIQTPVSGQPYSIQKPPEHSPGPPPSAEIEKPNYVLYAAVGVGAILLLRGR